MLYTFDWPEQAVSDLTEMWERGLAAKAIARAITRRYGNGLVIGERAITSKRVRIGLPARQQNPAGIVPKNSDANREKFMRGFSRNPNREPLRFINPDLFTTVVCEPVDLIDLKQHHCRWPIGDGWQTKYCGADKSVGSYCAAHANIAYEPASITLRKIIKELAA